MSDWKVYASMPPEMKDGRLILLADPEVGTFPMRWNPRGANIICSSRAGIWELEGGGMTWCDEDPDGAPSLWLEILQN